LQVIEELRAGRRGVREGELGPGETRIERHRLLEVRDGVGQEQLLEHVPALEELRLRLGRGRRHRDLSAAGRGRRDRRRGGLGGRSFLLRAAADGKSGGNTQYQEESEGSALAHDVLLRDSETYERTRRMLREGDPWRALEDEALFCGDE